MEPFLVGVDSRLWLVAHAPESRRRDRNRGRSPRTSHINNNGQHTLCLCLTEIISRRNVHANWCSQGDAPR